MRQSTRPVENFFASRAARRAAVYRVIAPCIGDADARRAIATRFRAYRGKCLRHRHLFHA
jgi:hypothetical protein